MNKKYYLDTSIWLDLFENRNEPNLPKGDFAKGIMNKIIKEDCKIIYSDAVKDEMIELGYNEQEAENLLGPLKACLVFVEFTKKQFGKAKDLSAKRDVPLLDAMHALIARDNKCIMVTRDAHFNRLSDIIKPKKPEDII